MRSRLQLQRCWFPIPWEQIAKPISRMTGDAGKDVGEPSLGIEVVEATASNE